MRLQLLIYLILPLFALGQNNRTTTLLINTSDCRDSNRFGNSQLYNDTIEIYRLNNKAPFYLKDTRFHDSRPLKVEGFMIGTYHFRYKNIFNQVITKTIKLKDTCVNYIELCPNRLKEYEESSILKSLKDEDSIIINYHYSGHRLATDSKMILKRVKGFYECSLYCTKGKCNYEEPQWASDTIRYTLLKSILLTESEIHPFKEFENELKALNGIDELYKCRWQSVYSIKTNKSEVKRCDCDNRWDGFNYLKKSLFNTIE